MATQIEAETIMEIITIIKITTGTETTTEVTEEAVIAVITTSIAVEVITTEIRITTMSEVHKVLQKTNKHL